MVGWVVGLFLVDGVLGMLLDLPWDVLLIDYPGLPCLLWFLD